MRSARSIGLNSSLDGLERATAADDAIHVVPDNLSTHKSLPVQRWFGESTRERIRWGIFNSAPALIAAVDDDLRYYNEAPRRFISTTEPAMIPDQIATCPEASNARD